MTLSSDDRARLRKQRTDQAIQFAIQNRWEDAAAANRQLLAVFPNDTEAWNRLGKSLGELGRYDEARAAYGKTIEVDPVNQIARKNLKRLEGMGPGTGAPVITQAVAPSLFIEETGKSGQSALQGTDGTVLRTMTPGDKVVLATIGGTLAVETARGERLGAIDPKLGLRLVRLMEGGNQYEAVLTSVEGGGRVLIKETYQHPSQLGRMSFAPPGPEGFRAHTRESMVRDDGDEDEDSPTGDEAGEEWVDPEESRPLRGGAADREVSFYDIVEAEEQGADEKIEE